MIQLPKLVTTLSMQEIFDRVLNHLREQKIASYGKITETSRYGSCLYRWVRDETTTLKCAAGCLIGDDEYNMDWEGSSWSDLFDDKGITYVKNMLIKELQQAHDNCMPRHPINDADRSDDSLKDMVEWEREMVENIVTGKQIGRAHV